MNKFEKVMCEWFKNLFNITTTASGEYEDPTLVKVKLNLNDTKFLDDTKKYCQKCIYYRQDLYYMVSSMFPSYKEFHGEHKEEKCKSSGRWVASKEDKHIGKMVELPPSFMNKNNDCPYYKEGEADLRIGHGTWIDWD